MDNRHAKIYFSYINSKVDKEKAMDILHSDIKRIRYQLGANLKAKFVPTISFVFDDSYRMYEKIDRTVNKNFD